MRQYKIPAAFIRGGTSNAVVFKASDLPERALWDEIFLAAIGSPDPYGRQLNGMGGGISSLSKVCIVGPPTHPDADVDYTFAQVGVDSATVDYGGNCGNMSSAIGPFAVDEGLVPTNGGQALIRIHNTNTKKIIEARFELDEGFAAVDGMVDLPGVADTGAPVDLDYLSPGGAGTGALLPTGNVVDTLDIPGHGAIDASLVDAANPFVFVRADAVGISGTELPADLDANPDLMRHLEAIRACAGVAMGYAPTPERISADFKSVPKIGIVAAPATAMLLSGEALRESDMDLTARMVSMGNVHRALPLTGVLGIAVAARIEGTVVHALIPNGAPGQSILRMAHPSGVVEAASTVEREHGQWVARIASVRRTQRRLFDGYIYLAASRVPGLAEQQQAAD
jgi:2-methylaconitate cis-trans-isomerase PrpF